ncbi:hypothetical protein [Rummeliibacillus pycnus]|uniref:hypothetical protein n=1 Tax=Rummeliibacillus pycnus TaxID=101070 RepID=UPI003D2BA270
MIFNFVLKHVFKASTEEEKLKASLIYGWGLAFIGIVSVIIADLLPNVSTPFTWIVIITLGLFIMRYTSVKPILGAAAGGITVVAIGAMLENLFNRRDNALSMGALFGVIIVLFGMIVKNLIVSWFYLIRETIRYYKHKKNNSELSETVFIKANA